MIVLLAVLAGILALEPRSHHVPRAEPARARAGRMNLAAITDTVVLDLCVKLSQLCTFLKDRLESR